MKRIAPLLILILAVVGAWAQDAPLNSLIRTDLDPERIAEIRSNVYAAREARAQAEARLNFRKRTPWQEILIEAGVQGADVSCSLKQVGTVNSGSGTAVSYNWSDGQNALGYTVTRAGISFPYPGNVRAHSEVSGCSFSASFTVTGRYGDGSTCTINSTGSAPHTAPCTANNAAYQAVAVNSASYTDLIAPGAMVSIFAANMTSQTVAATSLPLPTTLGGVKVYVFYNTPLQQECRIFYASPKQVNVLLPANMPYGGLGTLAVVNLAEDSLRPTWYVLNRIEPAIFTRSEDGHGNAAGYWIGNYVILFGSGFNDATTGFVFSGGQRYPVSYLGAQGQYVGLTQINAPVGLPHGAQAQVCAGASSDDVRCSQVLQLPQ
ncbi:MAG: hypothetical protein ABI977_11955 [Acidobacteriota bacterium]